MSRDSRDADESPHIVAEERGTLAVIRINRPEQRNSLSVATLEEFERVVAHFASSVKISALIFTGTGDVFASGADIRELQTLTLECALELATRSG